MLKVQEVKSAQTVESSFGELQSLTVRRLPHLLGQEVRVMFHLCQTMLCNNGLETANDCNSFVASSCNFISDQYPFVGLMAGNGQGEATAPPGERRGQRQPQHLGKLLGIFPSFRFIHVNVIHILDFQTVSTLVTFWWSQTLS